MNHNTLIISPHCDDEVLGCGGILNNRRDLKTFVYYLGVDNYHIVDKNTRMSEVEAVSKYLNFDYEISSHLVNNYKKQDLINEITDKINELKPIEIFIPNPAYNQDHKEVYEACIIALRPHDLNYFVRNVFIYEVDQYQIWAPTKFVPNYFEEIDIDIKVAAYNLHNSQVRSMRPPELLKNISEIYGLSSGYRYAEGFVALRIIK